MTRIAVVCHQTYALDIGTEPLVAALGEYVRSWLGPAWGCAAEVVRTENPSPEDWLLVIADDSDQAGALGYHDLETGRPRGFVFARTSQASGEGTGITASHELAELLLDPGCNLAARSPRGRWVAREICDPVQGSTITVNGIELANFVLPSWFGAGPAPYDAAGVLTAPWQILPLGYVPVWDGQWRPLFGSFEASGHFLRQGKPGLLRRWRRRRSRRPADEEERWGVTGWSVRQEGAWEAALA